MHRFRWALLLGSIVMLLVIMTAIWRSPYPHRARVLLHDMAQTKAATYRNARGEAMAYRLLFPFGYQRGAQEIRYPLVISLHGDGCSGSDNVKQLTHVFPALSTAAMRQQYPCFVLAPQCPARTYWVDKHCYHGAIVLPSLVPTPGMRLLLGLIPEVQRHYPIDPARIYVIGYSSGGTGVWELITRRPHLCAAAVPLCGRGDPGHVSGILHLPIWVFHGAKDHVVGCACARIMVRSLTKAGGHPRYTEYPDAGHEAGPRALQDPALFAWLFAQRNAQGHGHGSRDYDTGGSGGRSSGMSDDKRSIICGDPANLLARGSSAVSRGSACCAANAT